MKMLKIVPGHGFSLVTRQDPYRWSYFQNNDPEDAQAALERVARGVNSFSRPTWNGEV